MRKINQYTCQKCGATITTVEEVEGTTSFMLPCMATDGCTGQMQSHVYMVDQTLEPAFEWYKPRLKDMKNRKRAFREHVALGGLLIRPLKKDEKPEAGDAG